MGDFISLIILFLIGSFISHVQSTAFRGRFISQITSMLLKFIFLRPTLSISEYGNIKQYCMYNDIKVSPGASLKLAVPERLECKCTTRGLQCHGFDFVTDVTAPPNGCVGYNDACHSVFIKKNDLSEVYRQTKLVNKRKKNRKLSANQRT